MKDDGLGAFLIRCGLQRAEQKIEILGLVADHTRQLGGRLREFFLLGWWLPGVLCGGRCGSDCRQHRNAHCELQRPRSIGPDCRSQCHDGKSKRGKRRVQSASGVKQR